MLHGTNKNRRPTLIEEVCGAMNNPSTEKLKRKSFLRKSANKMEIKQPLREQSTNIPLVTIDLSHRPLPSSQEPIEKCRNELSLQKKILLKELERKEEKMEQLRLTFRKIQTNQPREFVGDMRSPGGSLSKE